MQISNLLTYETRMLALIKASISTIHSDDRQTLCNFYSDNSTYKALHVRNVNIHR